MGIISILNKPTLESIVGPIAFAGVAAFTKGLKITDVVAAALVEGNNVVYGEIFVGAAALAGVVIAIDHILADCDRDFAPWGFIGFH